jgi:6-phosphogluconolactonase
MNSVKTSLVLLLVVSAAASGAEYFAFSGGYAAGGVKGIYAYRFDPANGTLKALGLAAETDNPAYLAVDAKRNFLFAVHEGGGPASVSSFAIDAKRGKLSEISRVRTQGSGPCHLTLDGTGRWLAVANYGSGSVMVLPVAADGTLGQPAGSDQHKGSGPNQSRQASPHAHSVAFSPDNRFLAGTDLGADQVYVYRFDAANGSITPVAVAKASPGAGPRHLAFHPSGRALYTVNELAATVTAFRFDPNTGALQEMQTLSTLPEGYTARSAAEIAINPAGTALYASNRGHDSIARFTIDPARFTLSAPDITPAMGRKPRYFTLDPTGKWLVVENQESGAIVVFPLRPENGEVLEAKRQPVPAPAPVGLVFVPAR